ncbi:MAG TPA: hypothetical protein VGE40_04305 [Bacilli bacterium]
MRVPPFEQNVRLLQSAGIFLSGIIVGGALFMGMYHHNFNELYLDNMSLRKQAADLQEENDNLKLHKNNQTVINHVQIHLEKSSGPPNSQKAPDPLTVKELERKTKQDMMFLVGHSVEDIPDFVQKTRGLMNRRIYPQINRKDYVVSIKTILVINGGIEIWIAAEEFIRKEN